MARNAARIGAVVEATPTKVNADGYPAYDRTFKEQLIQALVTNTLTNTFYADEKKNTVELANLLDAAVQTEPVFLGKALAYARNVGFMRTAPVLGLVKLSGGGKVAKAAFETAFPQVVKTPSDAMDFFTILAGTGRGTGGRLIKRVAGKWLRDTISPYWVVKYGGTKSGQFSYRDLFRITKPKGPENTTVEYLVNGTKNLGGKLLTEIPSQITAVEMLKTNGVIVNPRDRAELIRRERLPHEIATQMISTKEEWTALGESMPIFALLRNLATLARHEVIEEPSVKEHIRKTFNGPAVLKSKIFPFRFIDAMKVLETGKTNKPFERAGAPAPGWVLDSLRDAVEVSVGNLPELPKNTTVMLDVSGSMRGQFLEIGSVFGVALMKATQGQGRFIGFDTNTYSYQVSMRDSILTQAAKIQPLGGTNTALPIQLLTRERFVSDVIVMITDEQQNTGSQMYQAMKEYRQKVNPNAKLFVIDVAPYNNHMVPPTDKLTHYIFGWSDAVLKYVGLAANGWDGQVAAVEAFVGKPADTEGEA